ncbi:MAG: NADPH:quinone reductase [Schleiferilactobacillus perolens]|nr:NADPH:quinone reductase [Schleiferilactobacillus perolens]MCI2170187.1 NADPH:quinone reductase [Schleiferilactobacillus perolens]
MTQNRALSLTGDPAHPYVWVTSALKAASKLPADEVIVQVTYSHINHKDRLALDPANKVIPAAAYPRIGGIDLAGVVAVSKHPMWPEGTPVLATGFDIGITRDGGFAEYCQLPIRYLVQLPDHLSAEQAMQMGTAGLTAGAALAEMFRNPRLVAKDSPLLITGGHSDVARIAAGILHHRGFTNVTVNTNHHWPAPSRPLAHAKYAAVLDTVGGDALSHLLPQMMPNGAVLAVGNLGEGRLDTSIFPFILRGVRLIGIDSVHLPISDRAEIWQLLATNLAPQPFPPHTTIPFAELPNALRSQVPTPLTAVQIAH